MIIILHGKRQGFIRIERSRGELFIRTKNIPEGSVIYAVNEKNMPILLDKSYKGQILGIIVTDDKGNILCEGRAGHTRGTNELARLRLPHIKQMQHSAVLDEILKRKELVFSKPEKSEKTENAAGQKPQQGRNNPFSSMYPNSTWKRQPYGRTYMMKGTAETAGVRLEITALPAHVFTEREYRKRGFDKVVTADDGREYRVKVRR